jgi:hypothetical protein
VPYLIKEIATFSGEQKPKIFAGQRPVSAIAE